VDSRSETLLGITKEATPSPPRRTHYQVSFQFLYVIAGTVTGSHQVETIYGTSLFLLITTRHRSIIDGAVANDTDLAANKITPADNNTMSSDPYSDDGDGKGGKI
jgi:hypothetical protein